MNLENESFSFSLFGLYLVLLFAHAPQPGLIYYITSAVKELPGTFIGINTLPSHNRRQQMTNTIHKYHPSQKKWIQIFCNEFYNKGKSRRLFDAVLHQGKRWWTYGVAAIVAHAMTGHGLYSRGIGFSSSRVFFNSSSNNNNAIIATPSITHALLMELTLWTAGFGLAWYTWLSHLYMSQVNERTKKLMDEMDRVCSEPKSNVWVMMIDNSSDKKASSNNNSCSSNKPSSSSSSYSVTADAACPLDGDNNNNHGSKVLGVAILKCHQVQSDPLVEEGQIQVAALESRIQLALVENAIQFARQQGIKVITQDHKKNRLDSFF